MDEYAYVVNVDGVVVRNDEYLLIERGHEEDHASGRLAFPGGKVEQPPDENETIEQTAVRELSEEVGVEVGDVEYVLSSTFETDDGTQCLNIVTLCEYVGGEARPRAPDEVAAVHWLSYDEIEEHEAIPPYIERYADRVEAIRSN
ncbi:NUDIX hydrolase [Halocatena marina]|uniref:NUDIX hydrolase n=1 Tax=Halocatena marina TaxID=2934937 RepID=A0ABD5YK93_9EURY|nr:NUDIX hydrolase [Halocatena marina]